MVRTCLYAGCEATKDLIQVAGVIISPFARLSGGKRRREDETLQWMIKSAEIERNLFRHKGLYAGEVKDTVD